MNTATHRSQARASDTEREFRTPPQDALRRRFRGCLLGGAIGDALGAPVEFMSLAEIHERFGPKGIVDFTTAFERPGSITDDTQMTLFTADGLLRTHVKQSIEGKADVDVIVSHAYQRWLTTQGNASALVDGTGDQGWLIEQRELFAKRVPGHTCITSLVAMPALGAKARNESKGCGGVMRVAPVGLYCAREPGTTDTRATRRAFDLGCEVAALTHGHPSGQVAAGAMAALVTLLARGHELDAAVEEVMPLVTRKSLGAETQRAIAKSVSLAQSGEPDADKMRALGEGWTAHEALAIALYAALAMPDFTSGVLLAVNHDGDSDSTGAIAGNLLGARHGIDNVPRTWLSRVELGTAIAAVADDLATFPDWPIGEYVPDTQASYYWRTRYPPC
ncbi:MAG TPA: ADP-ribosylglycohydrolase family protein [Casimicrobiaceae bacterium]|nr:ADP-ribosylglycohydrolase family protein [Casimicrobiaceae bacterium]